MTTKCERRNCFGNERGACRVLIANYKHPCPFFKTEERIEEEKEKTKERLKSFKILCRYDKYDN